MQTCRDLQNCSCLTVAPVRLMALALEVRGQTVATVRIANLKGETKMFVCLSGLLRTSLICVLACFLGLVCVSAVMSQAQSNAADLQGIVRDQNGAVVANASVTARNIGTNIERETTTNDDGFYKIVNLPPG